MLGGRKANKGIDGLYETSIGENAILIGVGWYL